MGLMCFPIKYLYLKCGSLNLHNENFKCILPMENFNPSLPYGELKSERWASKILLLLNKGLNKIKKP